MHRESSRGRSISHTAIPTEKLERHRNRRILSRKHLLREVEELRDSSSNVDKILQTVGRYIHDNRARPSSVPRSCDMPRGISIISGWYATGVYRSSIGTQNGYLT